MRILIIIFFLFTSLDSISKEQLINTTFGWHTENVNVDDFKRLEIIYDYDKADIRPESKQLLDSVYIFLQCHPYATFYIENHTDSRGNDKYNSHLTLRRAKICVDYLISKGIAPDRLEAFGKGEEELIYSDKYIKENAKTKTEQELLHQINRRTVLRVKTADYKPTINIDLLENTSFLESNEESIKFLAGGNAKTVKLTRFEKTYINWSFTNYITDEFQKQKRYYLIYQDDHCTYKIILFISVDEIKDGLLSQLKSTNKYKFDSCKRMWELME